MTAPYREDSDEPRYICIVCYGQTAKTAEVCPRCSVPMQAIVDAEIVAELRRRAASKKKNAEGRRMRFVLVSSFVTAVLVNGVLLWRGVYDLKPGGTIQLGAARAYVAFFIVPLFLWLVISTLYDRITRRLRLFAPLASIDADKATTSELLHWLEIPLIRTDR